MKAVTIDECGSVAWGDAVASWCASRGIACRRGVVRSGIFPEDEGAVVICKGAAAAADRAFNPPWVFDRVERLVLIDECPLWQASVHVNGRTALEWDDPTGVSRARAMVSHGSWSHASKDWLPPEPERLRSVMQELGLTIKPWKTDRGPALVFSRNPGGFWYLGGSSDPLRRWIEEDDARMARATSELGRPVELRLHPRTSPGARAARLFARTPPGCSIRPDGELLATALSRASVVDVGAGGSCVLAALEGVPSVAWSGTERSQIDAAGFSDSDRDTLLAVIAAHSVSMTELRSGEYDLFRTRSSPPTG
jgi:hypothetical protein